MLGDYIELAYGKALKAEDRENGSIPVWGSNGRVGWHNQPLAAGPGIVVERKGNPGTINYIRDDFFCIDTTFYVVPRKPTWNIPFLWLMMDGLNLPRLGADSAVPGLNRDIACRAECTQPDEILVSTFSSAVEPMLSGIAPNEAETNILGTLRDFLLPKLINGEIYLKAAEQSIEDAL
jgi:type I restriction enzyme, S subunit